MTLVTSVRDLVPVTPTAAGRTAAYCLVDEDDPVWPRRVRAWSADGRPAADVLVEDASEAFVVVAKLLTLLEPWSRTEAGRARVVVEEVAARHLQSARG